MIIGIICLILLSGFFSATETAFTSANRIRLKHLASEGSHRAEKVLAVLDRYDRLISALLIGNNLVNIAASTMATLLFTVWFAHNGATWSTITMTVLVLFFGEITPKTIAKEIPEKFAMAVIPIVSLILTLLTPLTFLIKIWQDVLSKLCGSDASQAMTEDELITMIDEVEEEGGLDEQESDLIRSAIEFNDVTAEEILTHRVKIIGIDKEMTMEEVGKTFTENSFSRLPVYEDTIDDIIGVLHERDYMKLLLDGADNWLAAVQPTVFFPENAKIQNLLQEMQEKQCHLSVIVDEYGGTQGIVTMEDILEELVGEIWDEHDQVVVDFKKIDDKTFMVSGSMDLDELFEELELDVDEDAFESTTISGWASEMLEKIPEPGDTYEFENLLVQIQLMEDRRVQRVLIILKDPPEEEE